MISTITASGGDGQESDAVALVNSLVTEYSPAIFDLTGEEAHKRAKALSATIRQIVKKVVSEECGVGGASHSSLPTKNETDSESTGKPTVLPTSETKAQIGLGDRIHDELWRQLVQPHLSYADYMSSSRFQTQLSIVQRNLARSLASRDYHEVDSAVFDVLFESVRERGSDLPPHPFRDFSRFRLEREWWNYFSKAAERRYIRNASKRVIGGGLVSDLSTLDTAEHPDVERVLLERRLAVQEIDNLPDTFNHTQREILKRILEGYPFPQSPRYSEGYIRKVLRKAIKYFQNRGREDS